MPDVFCMNTPDKTKIFHNFSILRKSKIPFIHFFSVWQHVDCMGIDRQNIPEEYKCELCQPRTIDRNRARTLQLMKRKEQQNFILMNSSQLQPQSQPPSATPTEQTTLQTSNSNERSQLNTFSTIAANKKKGTLNAKNRKVDLFGAGSNNKRKRNDSLRSSSSKRRETKKSLSSKRKTSSTNSSNASTPAKQHSNAPTDNNDKQAANLRAWIENYEAAMTNHYSPELRARLHSITKQSSTIPMLKNTSSLDNKCTTVPHAGAKILISTREIAPNNPVIELRGKYMLSTQYKPQQPTNSQSIKSMSKHNPGPFLFFYRLPNDGPEMCVDTRTYGNEARFVRRSCRPNAEILHTIEKGIPHLYIVSLNTIRSSTEITIRHEPHDLESLGRSEITAPTSTACGCGLIKDCIFGSLNANSSSTPSTPSTPTSSKKSSKRSNGHIKEKNSSLSSSSSQKNKKNKSSPISNRNRSTSGSGDSHLGMLSPSSSKSSLHNQQSTDEALNTKSSENNLQPLSSPIPQNQPNDLGSVTPSTPTNDKITSRNLSVQFDAQALESTALQESPTTETKQSKDVIADTTHLSPIKQQIEEKPLSKPSLDLVKDEPIVPVSILKSPSSKLSSHKKATRKSTCSLSEDSSSIAGDEFTNSTTTTHQSNVKKEKEPKKAVENKKLTREERKMEAIVRAFEKMEKTEQRKNEQNKKSGTSVQTTTVTSSANNKRRTSSSHAKDKNDGDKTPSKKLNLRRKRKRGKSYNQPNNQRRRRNRYDSHNTDDGNSSDESSTLMMSPTLPSPSSQDFDRSRHSRTLSESNDKSQNDNLAAGLLLSLSGYGASKNSDKNCLSSPDRYNKSTPNTPPFPVSSACLLIEAAVGPLDNDFKLPAKTKTKKTIMNEWLHQSDGSLSYNQDHQHRQILSPSIESYSSVSASYNDEQHQQHFSITAQKIEEFIHLTSSEQPDDDESSKWSGSPICTSSEAMTVPTPLPTPPLQMGSSVKKRWLRQAISEECSDDILATSSATSSPPNGFMAPLKKRRVARQCSDINSENLPSPVLPNSYESNEEKHSDHLLYDDKMDDTNEENDAYDEEDNNTAPVIVKTETETFDDVDVDEEKINVNQSDDVKPIEKAEETLNSNPIEIDSQVAEKLEIKMEVEDTEPEQSTLEVKVEEREEDKSILIADKDIKSSEISGECSNTTKPLPAEVKENSESDEKQDVKVLIKEQDEEHKAEIGKPLGENQTVEKDIDTPPAVLPKEEIEDIQQKLHSFHSENLMILQTRNKKRVSRATTPTSFEDNSNSATSTNFLKESLSPSGESTKKYRKSSSDERDIKREDSTSNSSRNSRLDDQHLGDNVKEENLSTEQHYRHNQLKTEDESSFDQYIPSHPQTPQNPSKSFGGQVQSLRHQNLPPPTALYQSTMTPPSFANVHPQLSANMASTNSLYQYLENPNRTVGYTTDSAPKTAQAGNYNSNIGFNVPNTAELNNVVNAMLRHQPAKDFSRPPPSMFGMHQNPVS